jgi:hypothetical protein
MSANQEMRRRFTGSLSTSKRFELITSTENSPIFEAKPRLPQSHGPGNQRRAVIREYLTTQETPIKYFDQAAEDTDENTGEEASDHEISDAEISREEEFSLSCSELPQQREERTKPTVFTELKISEARDSIVKVNDHKVIFIDTKRNPVDRGALEIKEARKLPHYGDVMFERARLYQDSGKQIISLPMKENRNVPITAENLLYSLKTLLDVVNEKLTRTIKKLKEVFLAKTIHITICSREVTTPPVEARTNIIREKTRIVRSRTQRSNENLPKNTATLLLGKHEEGNPGVRKNM